MRTKYRMKFNSLIIPVAVFVAVPIALRAAAPDFTKEIKPILEQNCLKCHGEEQKRGGLRLHTKAAAITGGDTGTTLVPGKSKDSPLYTTTIRPADADGVMPPQPKNKRLSQTQTDLLKAWIDQGAAWPDDVKL